MKKSEELPVTKNKKIIDKEKFNNLAKKVKEYFEKENKYLEGENGTNKTGKVIIYS